MGDDLKVCPFCKKLPGTKVGPPAMARCITDGCEGKKLAASSIADWQKHEIDVTSDALVTQVKQDQLVKAI